MGADTDTMLLLRWHKQHDARAFREIASRHSGMVFATCRRVLGNAAEAEDVTQECFLALAQRADAPPDSLPSWLHVVAVRRSLNRLRAAGRRMRRERQYAELQDQIPSSDWDAIMADVDEAIAALPEEMRAVIVLHFFEERSQKTIAELLNVSQSTISRRIDDGIARVRRALARKGVSLTGAALAAGLRAQTAEAAPASLSASLGKLALVANTGGASPALSGMGATAVTIGGFLLMKKIAIVGAGLAVALGGAWYASENLRPEPQSPSVPVADIAPEPEIHSVEAEPEPAEMAALDLESTVVSGTISGRVYDALTDEGVEGVEITAEWYVDAGENKESKSAFTDAAGHYTIADLAIDDSLAFRVERGTPDGYRPPTHMETQSIQLPAGGVVTDVDFALKPDVLIQGRVVNMENRPVADALVRLSGGMDTFISRKVTSDRNGAFTFDNLPATSELWVHGSKGDDLVSQPHQLNLPEEGISDLLVVLEAAGTVSGIVVDPDGNPLPNFDVETSRRPISRTDTGKGKKTDEAGRFEVWGLAPGSYELSATNPNMAMGGSEVKGLPIELRAGEHLSGLTLVYDRQLRIAGWVRNGDGEPIAGATVTVASPQAGGDYAETNADGAFEVTELLAGSYSVDVQAEGYMLAEVYGVDAGTDDLVIEMPPPFRVTGTVTDARTREPIPEFELVLTVNWGDEMNAWAEKQFNRVSSPNGQFELGQAQTYRSILAARAPGYATAMEFLDLTGPPYKRTVDLKLQAGGDLEGRVVDSRRQPIANVNVFYGPAMHHGDRATATTNEEGKFQLKSFPAAGQLVSAYHERYAVGTVWVDSDYNRNQPIEIMLPSGGRVQGTVRFAEGVTPVPCSVGVGYEIRHVVDLNADVQPDGTYTIDRVAPGEVSVAVQVYSTGPRTESYGISKTATITEAGITTVDFEVFPVTSGLEGVIVYPTRALPRSVTLILRIPTDEGEFAKAMQPTSDGAFAFESTPGGTGTLEVDANFQNHRRINTTVSVRVPDGETGYVTVPL